MVIFYNPDNLVGLTYKDPTLFTYLVSLI